MNYSVPYEYIRQKVDVRLTRNVIEVFFQGNRICSHPRLHGTPGQYATVVGHMPENHRQYTEWNSERFISWAGSVGSNTESVVRGILLSHRVEQQGYRACMALLKLADKYSLERLETACERALSYTPQPGYKSIQTILQTGQDKLTADRGTGKDSSPEKNTSSEFGFTRGAAYYGRNTKVTNQTTITKLHEMKLSSMAESFKKQLQDPAFNELTFEERFGIIADAEWSRRKSNHLSKLVRKAEMHFSNAAVEDIEYHTDRKLDKAQITRLSACGYIAEKHNILILGASGAGKTYLSCAFGVSACRNFYTVKYIRLPDLLNELAVARGEGIYPENHETVQKGQSADPGRMAAGAAFRQRGTRSA